MTGPLDPAALVEALGARGVRPDDGVQLVAADRLARRPVEPGWPLVVLPATGAVPDVDAGLDAGFDAPVLPGRHARPAEPLAVLRGLYPPDQPALALDGRADTTLGQLTPEALADGTWLLPPLEGEHDLASPHALPWLAARLRAPDGCPWDREQDHRSLKKFLLEEAYEVYDALDGGATPALAEELGDLLLQVVLHAQYAAEAGVFDLSDVYRAIMAKIVRRHPHVFGDAEARSAEEVLRNWERIKAGERADAAAAADAARTTSAASGPEAAAAMPEAFAGLSRSLPGLAYAQEIQERAASLGYDWPDIEGVIEKLAEEATELLGAQDEPARREEFGDLLLVIVNLGRKLGIDAEAAMRAANAKFAHRFARVERYAEQRGTPLSSLTFEELDELWDRAKADERAGPLTPVGGGSAGDVEARQ